MGCCQACWGHSGIILGLTTAARYAPVLLLSPYAGLLVDRYSKRRVLLATQAGLGLVSAALGAAVLTGDVRLWQVVVLAVLFGTFSTADNPARQAFVQEMVGRDLVRDAVTLNTTTVNVARVIGPTVAAVLVGTVGIGWCFVVNAASFGFVIVSLLSLDTRRLHPVPPVPRGRGQLRAGDRDRRVRAGRRGQRHLPDHGQRHHPARLRKVFTAAMTGNLVLLGIGVASTHRPAGPNAVTVVISLAAFAAGVALAIPTVLTAVVIAIAWVALKPRATSGLAGQQGLPVQQAVK
jgi:MFS family permease